MTLTSSTRQPRNRSHRRHVRARATRALVAVPPALVIGCGTSSGDRLYVAYPSLRARRPSGITIVSASRAASVAATETHPVWVSEPSRYAAASLPEIASARELRHNGRRRVWIARSTRGGVCLLVFAPELAADPGHAHSVSASCGTRSEIARGVAYVAQTSSRVRRSRSLVLGLVPAGVQAVSVTLADGRHQAVPVSLNLYSAELTGRVVTLTPLPRRVRG
jgi:hypothetical protein